MIVNKKIFPSDLKTRICRSVKKSKVDMMFYDGADVLADKTNVRFIEPYKVLFKSKTKTPQRYMVALIFESKGNKLTMFINEIADYNKCSLTKLIQIVNDNLS